MDLFKVVRESIRTSTPSYSIKHIEKFYRGARAGDVQTAGASIVDYERYLQTRQSRLLDDIERYNEDDVRSLQQLHEWPTPQRPSGMPPWVDAPHGDEQTAGVAVNVGLPSAKLQAYLERRRGSPCTVTRQPPRGPLAGLRRACAWPDGRPARVPSALRSPQWWEMFQRASSRSTSGSIGGRDRGLDARARHDDERI